MSFTPLVEINAYLNAMKWVRAVALDAAHRADKIGEKALDAAVLSWVRR